MNKLNIETGTLKTDFSFEQQNVFYNNLKEKLNFHFSYLTLNFNGINIVENTIHFNEMFFNLNEDEKKEFTEIINDTYEAFLNLPKLEDLF